MKYYLLCLSTLLYFFISSCTKNESIVTSQKLWRVRQVYTPINSGRTIHTYFTYDALDRISEIESFIIGLPTASDSQQMQRYQYTYVGNTNNYLHIDFLNRTVLQPNQYAESRRLFNYNTSNQIISDTCYFIYPQSDPYFSNKIEDLPNNSFRSINTTYHSNGSTTTIDTFFLIANNNVKEYKGREGNNINTSHHFRYTYDDKINPISVIYIPLYQNEALHSVNNITQLTAKLNSADSISRVSTFIYDASNYPKEESRVEDYFIGNLLFSSRSSSLFYEYR